MIRHDAQNKRDAQQIGQLPDGGVERTPRLSHFERTLGIGVGAGLVRRRLEGLANNPTAQTVAPEVRRDPQDPVQTPVRRDRPQRLDMRPDAHERVLQ
jgi:hypothetical protein